MYNRRTLIAIALAAASLEAAADDGDARTAQRLLEQARAFGTPLSGQAAGEIDSRNLSPAPPTGNQARWVQILERQSMN